MASVRTGAEDGGRILTAGAGAKGDLERVKAFAAKIGAELCATRKTVDLGLLPYSAQVGLTGRAVAPRLYLAVGVSGAVQHLAGMELSGTVIAVDPDPNAPIFSFADYGFLMRAGDLPLH
jgi:electron transfer flavoprotein alpha subunit